jgi:hypothetical protein
MIELDSEPGLPDGQQVTIVVRPTTLDAGDVGKAFPGLRRAFGAWAQDADDLDEYLQWNRRQRRIGLDYIS